MRFFETATPIMYEYQGFWGSFWDLIWWFLTIFIFVSYLFVLFAIIGDLFRDHKLNGWLKAIWVVALLFFPLITALIYLIARGRSMGERSQAQAQALRDAQAEYVKGLAGQGAAPSPADEIAKAKNLLDAGAISQAEYEGLKAKALTS
ncbi:SHOCT domain-containing protein [Microbacterium maritypicum]|nr:SHOCT domain-containing protein [Microbacterium liquefaciens]